MGQQATPKISGQEIVLDDLLSNRPRPEDIVRIPEQQRIEKAVTQRCWFRNQSRELTLFNGHYLECKDYKGRRLQRSKVINLAFIAPDPVKRRELAWGWGLAALAVLSLAVSSIALWRVDVGVVLAGISIIVAMTAARKSCDRQVFRTRYGGIAVLELYARLPSKVELTSLLGEIQEKCVVAEQTLPAGTERMAAEMAEHRRLFSSGVLSEARYALAKKRLFARFGRRPAGRATVATA